MLSREVPFWEAPHPSNILFTRPCIRKICDSMIADRKERAGGYAAICGQPGIGKSYAMFYLAYRFLQEADVNAVVLENTREGRFYFFLGDDYDKSQLPPDVKDSEADGIGLLIYPNLINVLDKLFLADKGVVYMVDMSVKREPSMLVRSQGYSIFSSSPGPYIKHLAGKESRRLGLITYPPPPYSKNELKAVYDYGGREASSFDEWKGSDPYIRPIFRHVRRNGAPIECSRRRIDSDGRRWTQGGIAGPQNPLGNFTSTSKPDWLRV